MSLLHCHIKRIGTQLGWHIATVGTYIERFSDDLWVDQAHSNYSPCYCKALLHVLHEDYTCRPMVINHPLLCIPATTFNIHCMVTVVPLIDLMIPDLWQGAIPFPVLSIVGRHACDWFLIKNWSYCFPTNLINTYSWTELWAPMLW